jgi:crotonobetainyl-CoA:carnitine CoA-transferase CaiB-like acyl-CoA transferase
VTLPLAGIRIVSLAEQYPGPYATSILADLGADVVLVERPAGGDPSRRFSGHFAGLNRNKRSLSLDLKSDAGVEVMWALLATADVMIEGFRPGVMSKLGFPADAMTERFPSLVQMSVSSFGQTGPLSPRGGHDISLQGMAGFVELGERPGPVSLPLADLSSAMFAAIGIVTALFARTSTGRGDVLDVAMLDALVSWKSTALTSALNGLDPAPYPPDDPGYGVFETQGGPITLSIAGEDHQWRGLCLALGLADLSELTTLEREADAADLQGRLADALRQQPWADVERRLTDAGVGFGPVHHGEAVVNNPQVAARGVVVRAPDDTLVVRQPVRFQSTSSDTVVRRGTPRLGEHTVELLTELGFSAEVVAALLDSGAAAAPTKEHA